MILVVGLGNPGHKYKKTRHNVGFLALNSIAGTDKWQESKKANCLYLKKQIDNKIIELIKPLTFMNNSGKCVRYIKRKHCIEPKDIIIIHDDIDLLIGTIRISQNISSAGHKGVQSIIDELGTKDFTRIRIGIKPLLRSSSFGGQAQDFVLEKFTKDEEKIIQQVIKKIPSSVLPTSARFSHRSEKT